MLKSKAMDSTCSTSHSAAALGRTTIPKVPLSYRWMIDDAPVNLSKCDEFGFRSPALSIPLPLKKGIENTEWELIILNHLTSDEQPSEYFSIYLDQNPTVSLDELTSPTCIKVAPSLLIANCSISILNPITGISKHTFSVPDYDCAVGFQLDDWYGAHDCIKKEDLNDNLQDGTLAIQVDAMLLCYSDPAEVVSESHEVPPDQIRQDIQSLYENDNTFADVAIKCADRIFKAHKVILASQSPVFKKMFQIDMKEKRSGIVEISDLSSEVFCDLLSYVYTGSCPNIKSLAKELLNAANKYELPRLMAMCEKELEFKVTAETVVELLLLADLHQAAHLKSVCMRFLKLNAMPPMC